MKYKIYYILLLSALLLAGCEEKTEEFKFSEYGVVNSLNPGSPIRMWPGTEVTISDISYGVSLREWTFTEGTLVNGAEALTSDASKVTLQFPEAEKTYVTNLHIEFKYPVIYFGTTHNGYAAVIKETCDGNSIEVGDTIQSIDWTFTITVQK